HPRPLPRSTEGEGAKSQILRFAGRSLRMTGGVFRLNAIARGLGAARFVRTDQPTRKFGFALAVLGAWGASFAFGRVGLWRSSAGRPPELGLTLISTSLTVPSPEFGLPSCCSL